MIYERYRFNNRKQEQGESIGAYVTELRVIAKNCALEEITQDEILRDRLVLGVRDEKVRERLLRINDLTFSKAIDICKAAEQTSQQLKLIATGTDESVGAVRTEQKNVPPQNTRRPRDSPINRPECRSCGYHHGNRQCPARGQTCHKCGQKNHFQSKCRSTNPKVNNVEEVPEEVFRISQVGTSNILAPVTEPTEWVSCMLVIVKPNKLRICLDPHDLNKVIRREHYQMPTVEEVSTRLSQANKFTVVDAKDGFW